MTSSAQPRRRFEFASADLDLDRFARPALALAVVASGLLIYHLTRGTSFSPDDWVWIDSRRGNSLNTFLAPYNGHLSLVPIAIYRLMFAVFGIGSFVPYRLLLFGVASLVGITIFEYARHRIGDFCALLVATLLLFIGPGWNDIMQPFQIAWLLAVAGGVLALSLLDRRRRAADAGACILILVSISSTSVGVAFAVGIALDLVLTRRSWRDLWIVALPLVLYAIWALHYHPSQIATAAITGIPIDLAQITSSAVAGVLGLSAVTPTNVAGFSLMFGIPLLALALAAVIVRTGAGWDGTRFYSLAATLVTFSILVTLVRSFQSPLASRYMYVTCVLLALMGVELARGLKISNLTKLVLAAVTIVVALSNFSVLRTGGAFFRQSGTQADAVLGAVELDRATIAPSTPLTEMPLYPIVTMRAGQYFAAANALGTPAYTLAQLQRAAPAAQQFADAQMLTDRDVTFAAATASPAPSGAAPHLENASGGTSVTRGSCVSFQPAGALTPGVSSSVTAQLATGRVTVSAGHSPVTISVRRFAPSFTSLGTVQPRGAAILSVSAAGGPQPWHLRILSATAVRLCSVGP